MTIGSLKSEVGGPRARAIVWVLALDFLALSSLAQEKLPALRPPLGEMPPTFWEQHGTAVLVAVPVAMLLLALGIWLWLRPKPIAPVPPEVQARKALEELLKQPEDGAVISRVSQILRRYVLAVFELPAGEPTTAEFSQLLATSETIGAELCTTLTGFLRQCDERKFAPNSPSTPGVATQALRLIEQAESRRALKSSERAQVV
jgi:hypothetical protein